MLSFRHVLRSAPRQTSRLAPRTARPFSFTKQISPIASKSQLWQSALFQRATFATSSFRSSAGGVDSELSAKFESELQMEEEMGDVDSIPENLAEFIDAQGYTIQDKAGDEEIVLTRTMGNEKIRISFSTADLDNLDADNMFNEDKGLYDEDEDSMQQGGAQSKAAVPAGKTRGGNQAVANADLDESETMEDEGEEQPNFPARVSVTITKPGSEGAMHIEALAQDGIMVIENVFYFPTEDLAIVKSAEKDFKRRNLYTGPPYANLDEELQLIMERYLAERGVNEALALWVPEYIDWKEQREYVSWLKKVKQFVDV